jgi:hypothetical protein
VSADQQRPAETAARQHREDEAALVVSQLAQDAHGKAVMAGPEGYSVTDRTDPRVTGPRQMERASDRRGGHWYVGGWWLVTVLGRW